MGPDNKARSMNSVELTTTVYETGSSVRENPPSGQDPKLCTSRTVFVAGKYPFMGVRRSFSERLLSHAHARNGPRLVSILRRSYSFRPTRPTMTPKRSCVYPVEYDAAFWLHSARVSRLQGSDASPHPDQPRRLLRSVAGELRVVLRGSDCRSIKARSLHLHARLPLAAANLQSYSSVGCNLRHSFRVALPLVSRWLS